MAGIVGMGTPRKLAQVVPGADEEQAIEQQTQDISPDSMPVQDAMDNAQLDEMQAQASAPAPAQRRSLEEIFSAPPPKRSLEEIFGASPAKAPASIANDTPAMPAPNVANATQFKMPQDIAEGTATYPRQTPELMDFTHQGKMSFANNDKEREHIAKDLYGKDAKVVRLGKDEWNFEVQLPEGKVITPQGNWNAADLGQYMRMGLVGTVMGGTDVAMAPGGLPGLAAASTLGAAAANTSTELIRANLLGKDYTPQTGLETAGNIAMDASLNTIGGVALKKAANVLSKYASRIADSTAVRDGIAKGVGLYDSVIASGKELAAGVDQLVQKGILPALPKDLSWGTVDELFKASKVTNALMDKVRQTEFWPIYQGWRGQGLEQAVASLKTALAGPESVAGRKALNEFKPTVKGIQDLEGKFVGEARDAAVAMAGDDVIDMTPMRDAITKVGHDLKVLDERGRFRLPTMEELAVNFNESEAKQLIGQLNTFTKAFSKDSTLGRLQQLREMLGNSYGTLWDKYIHGAEVNTKHMSILGDLKDAAEKLMMDNIEKYTGEEGLKQYLIDKQNYMGVKDAVRSLGKTLMVDGMDASALASKMLTKQKMIGTLDSLELIFHGKPEVLSSVKRAYLDNISHELTGDSTKIAKHLLSLGDDNLNAFLRGSNVTKQDLIAFSRIGDIVQKVGEVKPQTVGTLVKFFKLMDPQEGLKQIAALDDANGNPITAALTKRGVDAMIKTLEKTDKVYGAELLKGLINRKTVNNPLIRSSVRGAVQGGAQMGLEDLKARYR